VWPFCAIGQKKFRPVFIYKLIASLAFYYAVQLSWEPLAMALGSYQFSFAQKTENIFSFFINLWHTDVCEDKFWSQLFK